MHTSSSRDHGTNWQEPAAFNVEAPFEPAPEKKRCCSSCRLCCQDLWCCNVPAEERCTCCRPYPSCRKFWSNRLVRWVLFLLGMLFLAYVAYCVWAIIELSKMADSESKITSLVVSQLCANSIPISAAARIYNPSKFGVTLHEIEVTPRHATNPTAMGSMKFTPTFDGQGSTLPSGFSTLRISNTFNVISTSAMGEILSLSISNRKNIKLSVKYKVKVTVDAFLIPITVESEGETEMVLNKEAASAAEAAEAAEEAADSVFPPDPPAPKPELLSVQLLTAPNTNLSAPVVYQEGINIRMVWKLSPSNPGFQIDVPDISARVAYDGLALSGINLTSFTWQTDSLAQIDVDMSSMTQPMIDHLQTLTSYVTNNITFNAQATGLSGQSSSCMLQQALNEMPTAQVQVISKPFTDCNLAENREAEACIKPVSGGSSNSTASTSSGAKIDRFLLSEFSRPPTAAGRFKMLMQTRLDLGLNFDLFGDIPDIYIDIFSRHDRLGYVQVEATTLVSRVNLSTFNVSFTADQERVLVKRILYFTSINDTEISLRGRTGFNLLSDILGGWSLNITDKAPQNESQTTASPAPPVVGERPQLAIKADNTETQSKTTVFVDFSEMGRLDFTLIIPAFNISLLRRNTPIGDPRHAMSVSATAVYLGPDLPVHNLTAQLHISSDQSVHMRDILSDIFEDRIASVRFLQETGTSPRICLPLTTQVDPNCQLNFDVSANITKEDLEKEQTSTATSNDEQTAELLQDSPTFTTPKTTNRTLNVGAFLMRSVELVEWRRFVPPVGDNHTVGVNFTGDFQAFSNPRVDFYGSLPSLSIGLEADGQTILVMEMGTVNVASATDGAEFKYTSTNWQRRRPFSAFLQVYTAAESKLRSTLEDISNQKKTQLRVFGSKGTSTLATVLQGVNFTVDVNADTSSSTQSSTPADESSTVSAFDLDWSTVHMQVRSSPDSIDASIQTLFPSIVSPIAVQVSDMAATVDYHHSSLPVLTVGSITASKFGICEGCRSDFAMDINSHQTDNGTRLASWVNDFLGDKRLLMRLHGSAGDAPIDVWFETIPPPSQEVVDNVAGSISSAIQAVNESGSVVSDVDEKKEVTINEVHLIGSDFQGSNITFPCIVPDFICPVHLAAVKQTSTYALAVNFSVDHFLPFPLNLTYPAFSFDVDCCTQEHMGTFQSFSGEYLSKVGSNIQVLLTLRRPDLVQRAARAIKQGLVDFVFRVHGTSSADLISSMLRSHNVPLTIKKPSNTSLPSLPQDDEQPEFGYWLHTSTATSATVRTHIKFDWTMAFPWKMGDVKAFLSYTDVDFMSVSAPLNFNKGFNAFGMDIRVFGEESLSPRCSGAFGSNKNVCVLTEFLQRVMSANKFPEGTNATFRMEYTNALGQPVHIRMNLLLFAEEVNIRRIKPTKGDGYVKKVGATDVDFNGLTSIDLVLGIDLFNPLNISTSLTALSANVFLVDADGVDDYFYIPGTPKAPDIHFELVTVTAQNPPVAFNPRADVSFNVPVTWTFASDTDKYIRFYDQYFVRNQVCVSAVGSLGLQIGNLAFDQQIDLRNVSAVGDDACNVGLSVGCKPERLNRWSYGFPGKESEWNLNGDAKFSGGALQVADGSNEVASAYRLEQQNIIDRWQVEFDFIMRAVSCGIFDCPQGDGLVFIVQNIHPTALGARCSTEAICHGYKNIGNSIGVVFDSIAVNEIMLFRNGDTDTRLTTSHTVSEFDDESVHRVQIDYVRHVKRLYVTVDNKVELVSGLDLEDTNFFTWNNDKAWVGFSASTGLTTQSQIDITGVHFRNVKTFLNFSVIVENGAVIGQAGRPGSFTIDTRTSCDLPHYSGGETWTVTMQHDVSLATYNVTSVTDLNDGRYTVRFTVPEVGSYTIRGSIASSADPPDILGVGEVESPLT